ncbi:unnamed protein product [Clavelina lepadiformis]|uniref:DUF676 domain-containing protein n=1 Tax=Clavelina lepadiformis TaxID=159417 RepID=A0ABP0GRT5_CLALP
MDDLQATVEIAVDLGHFHNIDMFQRGFYKVTIDSIDPIAVRSNVEVHLLKKTDGGSFASPAKVSENGAHSATIQVLHKKQEVALDTSFLFRCHRLLDSRNIFACITSMKFQLDVKLWYCPTDNEAEITSESFEMISSRTIMLHIEPIQGLHEYTLVVFEYGFMAGIEMTVHASLVALHQPLIATLSSCGNASASSLYSSSLESILFRESMKDNAKPADLKTQINMATKIHNDILNVLCSIYTSLKDYFTKLLQQLPQKSKYTFEFINAMSKLNEMPSSLSNLNTKDDFLNQANMNLASACSHVLAFWSHILDIVCLHRKVVKKLSNSYHRNRIQRFQSSFFTLDNPRQMFPECRLSLYNGIANFIRSSAYYQSLPPLKLESVENDGVCDVMPVVFEDRFVKECKTEPIFNKKDSLAQKLQDLVSTSQPSTFVAASANNRTSLSCSSSPRISNTASKAQTTLLNPSLSMVKSPTDPLLSTTKQKYSEELYSYTLEEPDDLPRFSLHFSECSFKNKLIPPVKNEGIDVNVQNGKLPLASSTIPNNTIGNAFGFENDNGLSAPTLTSTMLAPLDEPECCPTSAVQSEMFNYKAHADKVKPERSMSEDSEKLMSIESFLKEEYEKGLLHEQVCEPAPMYAPDNEVPQQPDDKVVSNLNQTSIGESALSQLKLKHLTEKAKLLSNIQFPGNLFSDLPSAMEPCPYLLQWKLNLKQYESFDCASHLIILVHGLNGNSSDLRMVKTFLHLGLQSVLRMSGKSELSVSYLFSVANEMDTYDDIEVMTTKLIDEILRYINNNYTSKSEPQKISFIGHSLGGLLIRSAISHDRMRHLRSQFHTFLSFSSPHLGTIFNTSTLVNTGMWLIQKWKKSKCLQQLGCKEEGNMRKTYIYKLSKKPGLEFFKNVLLLASAEDKYVPYQSARIEMCRAAAKDKSQGPIYQEMISNIMTPILKSSKSNQFCCFIFKCEHSITVLLMMDTIIQMQLRSPLHKCML